MARGCNGCAAGPDGTLRAKCSHGIAPIMHTKRDHPKNVTPRPDRDSDTASYEQLQGTPDERSAPGQRNPKMPHERDESARNTGNRLDQPLPPSEREISQAHRDTESGLVDTERRGVPNDVPSKGKRRGSST
jgi:hypothetical protein